MNASTLVCLGALACALPRAAAAEPLPRFPPGAVWNQNIESAALHPDSAAMITRLNSLGGFGNGRLQIDFSFRLARASGGEPIAGIVEIPSLDVNDDYYLPDCEPLGSTVPVPAGATIEGETDMTCDVFSGDCHYLVVAGNLLHEVYRANLSNGSIQAQCLATWRLDVVYPEVGRGDHCTSADAAGFPIAPLLFNADEIAASLALDATGGGDLGHAIRFILPNNRIARDFSLPGAVGGRLYVRPATHAGGPTGPVDTVPYGARLRLRSDFPLDSYSPAARVVLNTLKRYGMVLSDGGVVALTAESDLYTTTKWATLGFDAQEFYQTPDATTVRASDFQMLDTGPRIAETFDCVRSAIALDVLFANGFE